MKANPGGQIDTKSVVGRSRLIHSLWETIEQQSLVITAERRIGKTTVIKKMSREPKSGWVPVYQDLEGCHTAAEFAMVVYKEIHQFLTKRGKATRRAKELFKALGGVEIAGVFKLPESKVSPWKDVLTSAIEDLIHENDATESKLLFLWDEMPLMLANIKKRESEETAMEVLDLLRALRQMHGGLRMVITGSIGLHHVLSSLKEKDYANSPVNDMVSIEVPTLTEDDASTLAGLLIKGEGLALSEATDAATTIAREADCFPFYIHHIVKALTMREWDATPENVKKVVAAQLVHADDPWELLHYRVRIPLYYQKDERIVLLILDELAVRSETVTVNDLLTHLKSVTPFDDRERLLQLLSLMERDHYLKRDDRGRHGFKFPLIRRWWIINRGL